MDNRKLAEFILGMMDMAVASELPQEEQLEMIEKDLDDIKDSNLYYYLKCAYDINDHQ